VDSDLWVPIIVNIIGLSIGIWFLASRLRAKLAEVEARQAASAERRFAPDLEQD